MNEPDYTPRRESGMSYVEILVCTLLIALLALPAGNAIRDALHAAQSDTQATRDHYRLLGRLESVLAEAMATVAANAAGPTTPSSYSDPVGASDRLVVFVSAYDGDNADGDNDPFTGTDADLLWVRVEIEGTVRAVQALKFN